VILGDAELVVRAAAELVTRIPPADYLITAEAKGIPLVHNELWGLTPLLMSGIMGPDPIIDV
jgi:hypothetical protein